MKHESLPLTEAVNPKTHGLDELGTTALVHVLMEEQEQAVEAAIRACDPIAECVDAVTLRLKNGGRLHYVGAGTSGRLGYLDASEAPPTFGTSPDLVCAHIAGGKPALTRAVEGAEDDGDAAVREFRGHVTGKDAVIGVSASGSAAYVVAALETAREIGAWTVAVVNTPDSALAHAADRSIVLTTGPEPLTGSTRLKAGNSQKLVLHAISTAVMVRLGTVYDLSLLLL